MNAALTLPLMVSPSKVPVVLTLILAGEVSLAV